MPEPAGFWPRAAAWSLDAAMLCVPAFLFAALFSGHAWHALHEAWRALPDAMAKLLMTAVDAPDALIANALSSDGGLRVTIRTLVAALRDALFPPLLLFWLFALLLWPWLEASHTRATFGKRWLGLQVLDAKGAALSWPHALRRFLYGTLSWLTLNIGHMMAMRGPQHRTLHDRLAKTQVTWRAGAKRALPVWAKLWLWLVFLLPLLFAIWAAFDLCGALNAALEAQAAI